MKKAIKTYEDLLQEEQRLKGELDSYKVLIKEDIQGLKEGLNPGDVFVVQGVQNLREGTVVNTSMPVRK